MARVQKLAEQDRVYRQRATSPVAKPPPSPSLRLVSIPRSHYMQGRVRAHRHTGIPIAARMEVSREAFCMNSVLGVRTTRSAANYK